MSTYVMSDLHGDYEGYIEILKKINFKGVFKCPKIGIMNF